MRGLSSLFRSQLSTPLEATDAAATPAAPPVYERHCSDCRRTRSGPPLLRSFALASPGCLRTIPIPSGRTHVDGKEFFRQGLSYAVDSVDNFEDAELEQRLREAKSSPPIIKPGNSKRSSISGDFVAANDSTLLAATF
ncbi:hypothetical protein R6Q59_020136 [Mikania micrantha]